MANRPIIRQPVGWLGASFKLNQPVFGDSWELSRQLPDNSIHCIVTSPPYWGLRDYGVGGQLGFERVPEDYIDRLVSLFRELRRALRSDGTLWLNLGDCYANDGKWGGSTGGKHAKSLHGSSGLGRGKTQTGLSPKNLVGIPWRVAFALQADGWCLRQDIIWHKPNPMPESVQDRCTKSHEYIFLMSKSHRYYYDHESVKELAVTQDVRAPHGRGQVSVGGRAAGGAREGRIKRECPLKRNRRSVWAVPTKSYSGAHFAVFPPTLIEPCILAGCPKGGIVLDPFLGSGTTGEVCQCLGRNWLGFELNEKYHPLIAKRLGGVNGK